MATNAHNAHNAFILSDLFVSRLMCTRGQWRRLSTTDGAAVKRRHDEKLNCEERETKVEQIRLARDVFIWFSEAFAYRLMFNPPDWC